jgi:hypothetical protein
MNIVKATVRLWTADDPAYLTRHWFGVALGYGDTPGDALWALWRWASWHAQKAANKRLPNAPQALAPAARVVWPFDLIGIRYQSGPVIVRGKPEGWRWSACGTMVSATRTPPWPDMGQRPTLI